MLDGNYLLRGRLDVSNAAYMFYSAADLKWDKSDPF